MRLLPPHRPAVLALFSAAVFGVACGSSGEKAGNASAADSAGAAAGGGAAAAPAATPAAGDSAMAGMDHSNMPGMASRPAPRDSNQAFLRMMSDHHAGLVALADSAQPRLQGATAKADARELRQKQAREGEQMRTMLARQYSDSVTPMLMPSNRAMLDSVTRAEGAAADPTFYRQVIAHHREAIQMVEQHAPHLTGEVKQMAERMRAEQQREIQAFERKASATGRS